MAELAYLVEFGQYQDGKWNPEFTLVRASLEEARELARAVASEVRADEDYYLGLNLQVQIKDDQQPGKLYHYITARHPDIFVPAEPLCGGRWLGRDERV